MVQRARTIVKDAVARGTGNFVEEVAAELPLQAIADLIGVPQEDRHKLFEWSNQMLAGEDPDYAGNNDVAAAEILGYAMMLAADRQANPRDDLITKLIHGAQGRAWPERRRVRLLRDPAGGGRQRDHPQRDLARHERLPRQPRAVGDLEARPAGDDGRRGRPVGHAGQRLPAHRPQRRRGQRPPVQEGRAGGAVLRQRQLRRDRLRGPAHASTSCATPTRSSGSAATVRTTAWAPTWPARRSG